LGYLRGAAALKKIWRKNMKKILVVLLGLCVFALPLFAGGGSQGASGGQAAGDKPVELTVWFYPASTVTTEDTYAALAAKVNNLYPNIKVISELQSFAAGPERFTLALATGATPDIYFDGYSRCAPAVQAGLTVDLTDVAQQIKPYINEPAEHNGTVNGKNYALDYALSWGYVLLANMDLVKKYGLENRLPADRLHWSYADFLDFLRTVKRTDPAITPIPLFAGSRSSDAWYYSWVLATGSDILNKEHTAVTVDNPQALRALTLFKTIIDEGLTQPGAGTMLDEDSRALWYSGKAVLAYGAFNNVPDFYSMMQNGELINFEMDTLPIPTPDGGTPRVASWGGSSIIGFRKDGDPARIDAIKKYILTFYQSADILKREAESSGAAFILKGTEAPMPTAQIERIRERNTEYTLKYSTAAFGILEPWWTAFRETLYPQLQELYTGRQTPKQALENWTRNGNAVISDALKSQ
jgi:ABC-type glycerol-3-phosphate transport system substrate-binding protein